MNGQENQKGHLIVMLSAGATIEDFSIFTAHVSATGGNYTKMSELWLNVNGVFLPVICSLVYLLFYKIVRNVIKIVKEK